MGIAMHCPLTIICANDQEASPTVLSVGRDTKSIKQNLENLFRTETVRRKLVLILIVK
jgi:hypothetical protein